MRLTFEIQLVILRMTSSAEKLKKAGVVAPSFTHWIAVVNVQPPTLSSATLTTMAGPGEHLAYGGIRNGRPLGWGNTRGSGRRVVVSLRR